MPATGEANHILKRQGPRCPQAYPTKRPCFLMTLRSPPLWGLSRSGYSGRACPYRGSSRQLSATIAAGSRLPVVSSLVFFLPSLSNFYVIPHHVAKARTRLTLGIYLHRPLFSHGQHDIALSRIGALQHLKVKDNKPMIMAHVSYIH